jgi:predicted acylesterase/phospholipase RssA
VVVLFDHDGLPVEEFPLLLRPDATVVLVQDQHHPVWRFGPGAPHRLIRVDRLSPRYVHQSKESAEELGRTFVNPELPTWEQTPVQGAMRAPDDPSGWAALAAGRLLETMRGGGVAARSCARLGRIVQGRAVGLALGGGGIWGAAHIALIRLMLDHHVPIDYVSGASFGSVVGGLYAGGGLPALEAFVQANAGPRSGLLAPLRGALGSPFFWAATLGAALSTRPIQRQIDGLILGAGGQQELPCTEVMFLPVATNLHRSCPMVAVQGTVGFGVRQSSGLPPMLPATLRGGVRLLDGAIISNVPAEVLRKAGASYVISANVVAPSTAPDHQSPLAGLLNASVWRLTDASRAMWVAMWKAGLDQGRLAADYLLDLWTADVPLWASWRAGEVAEAMMRDMLEARLGQDLRQHWSSGPPWPEQASARLGGARQEAEILRLPR